MRLQLGPRFLTHPRGASPPRTAAHRGHRSAAGPSNLTVDLPALGAHPRDLELRLPLTLTQICRASGKALGRSRSSAAGQGRRGLGVRVTCEGSRGLLPASVVISLSAASSPRSKLLLGPPGGGGGDGGGC